MDGSRGFWFNTNRTVKTQKKGITIWGQFVVSRSKKEWLRWCRYHWLGNESRNHHCHHCSGCNLQMRCYCWLGRESRCSGFTNVIVVNQVGFFRCRRYGGFSGVVIIGFWWQQWGLLLLVGGGMVYWLLLGEDGDRDKVGKRRKNKRWKNPDLWLSSINRISNDLLLLHNTKLLWLGHASHCLLSYIIIC